MAATSFSDAGFQWRCDPSAWAVDDPNGEKEGSGGSFAISDSGGSLTITPPSKKDYWRRTFYSPLLIKNDGPALLFTVPAADECTVQVDFTVDPKSQFDQGGILVYLDACHWLKCGIEFCDGAPRLSCVVCNVFSDWSTQPWPSLGARLRLHKVLQSSSVVVEAAALGSDDFHFFRIAHLSAKSCHHGDELAGEPEAAGHAAEQPWAVGPYAACPTAQKGTSATFNNFSISPRLQSVHSSDVSEMLS